MSAERPKENGLSSPLSGKDHGLENPCPLEGNSGEELGISEWRHKRVKDFGEIITGRTPSTARKDFYDGDYNLISPSDLDNGKYVRTAHKRLTKLGFNQCRALPKGTVLVGCIGNVGKLGLVGNDESATNQQINALICNAEYDPEFIYYCFHENRGKLEKRAVKTTVPILNKTNFGNFEINVPPLPEQKKIAHILSTVQRAIEAQESIIQTTTELKKALMHKLFTEGLRNEPQKQTEIGPVPESWEVKCFDSFAVLQRGFDITKKDQRPGEYPVVSSGGVSSYHDEPKVKGPGVIIGRKGSLGTVHYIPTDYWPHDTTLWVKDFKGNNPRFVAYLLETMRLKRFDTGAANPTLNRNIVHGEKIAIPPKDQQVEIGEALEAVESKIALHESRKRSFEDLFRTLLHELMTAKTRVHNLEDRASTLAQPV